MIDDELIDILNGQDELGSGQAPQCRANMSKLYGDILWCHSCSTGPEEGPGGGPAPVESQGHLEVCLAYSHLRVGRDVELCQEDKVHYFMELSSLREKEKWT